MRIVVNSHIFSNRIFTGVFLSKFLVETVIIIESYLV